MLNRAKIVGWPPIRSYRKNSLQENEGAGIYVKVSMDGAPYLRKIDLKVYGGYTQLLIALETMFKLTIGEKNFSFVCFYWDEMKRNKFNQSFWYCENDLGYVMAFQVSTLKKKVTRDPTMHQHMKTRTVTGCWLEMFHGSKCYISPFSFWSAFVCLWSHL